MSLQPRWTLDFELSIVDNLLEPRSTLLDYHHGTQSLQRRIMEETHTRDEGGKRLAVFHVDAQGRLFHRSYAADRMKRNVNSRETNDASGWEIVRVVSAEDFVERACAMSASLEMATSTGFASRLDSEKREKPNAECPARLDDCTSTTLELVM